MRIPLGGNGLNWIKIPDLICCFVDMEGSTKLSAELHERGTAKAYRYFTNTAISPSSRRQRARPLPKSTTASW